MRREAASTRERNQSVVARIKEIKAEHPFWGYRRTRAYLKYIDGMEINKKLVLRLMQRNDLLVKADTKIRATRTAGRSKPKPERPNQW
jgi:putative transposase